MFLVSWFFPQFFEMTPLEKEQHNFILLVEEICKYKILHIIYSQDKYHELPSNYNFSNKSKQSRELLFDALSEGLKIDIANMVSKEIERANYIITQKEFTFVKPLSLEESIPLFYYHAFLAHDLAYPYLLDCEVVDKLKKMINNLNKISHGWSLDYEISPLSLSEKALQAKEIEEESKKLRAIIAVREQQEATQSIEQAKEKINAPLKRAILRVESAQNKLEVAQRELAQAQQILENIKPKVVSSLK